MYSSKKLLSRSVLVGSVALCHAALAVWLWGYRPQVERMDKVLGILTIDASVNSPDVSGAETFNAKKRVVQPKASPLPVKKSAPKRALQPNSEVSPSFLEEKTQSESLPNDTPAVDAPVPKLEEAASLDPSTDLARGAKSEEAAQHAKKVATENVSNGFPLDFNIGGVAKRPGEQKHFFDAYLNGSKIARASYELNFNEATSSYEASFRIQAIGLTAWVWRGERIEAVLGEFKASGFAPTQLRNQQGDRPVRIRPVTDGAMDSISSVFQLMALGQNHGSQLRAGFEGAWLMQKSSRVGRVSVRVGNEENIVFKQKSISVLPIRLQDEEEQKGVKADTRTIWFAPELQWLPVRLEYSDGKYDVDLRIDGLSLGNLSVPSSHRPDAP